MKTATKIWVKGHYRTRGEAHPKWVLIYIPNRSVLVNIRSGTFHRDLGLAKPYFRNQLKRWLKEQGQQDSPAYLMLAVR